MALQELESPLVTSSYNPDVYKADPVELGIYNRDILHEELFGRFQRIHKPLIEGESRNILVARDVLEIAGVKYEGFDVLWGKTYPDGNVPEGERDKSLVFEFGKYYSTIGAVDQNVKLAINFNSQISRWAVDIRKINMREPYTNPDLVKLAKRAFGLSTQEVEIGVLGYKYDSFKRQEELYDGQVKGFIGFPLDIKSQEVVLEDYDNAQAHLNVIGMLVLRNKLPH